MGAPKGGGYTKKDVLTGTGKNTLEQILQNSIQGLQQSGNLGQNPAYQQALGATTSFLPGGGGGQPIINEANRNFQQNTIPSILNSLGGGNKGSSALNQALGAAGGNLNSSLASMLAQLQLQAAGQTSTLAGQPRQESLQGANLGLNTSPFAYMQRATPFWQDATLAGINAGGQIVRGALSG